MTYTSHGHHIPGTVLTSDRPEMVARCGGPGLCDKCSREAARWTGKAVAAPHFVDHELQAKITVVRYHNSQSRNEFNQLTVDDLFTTWFSKALENWKALIITTVGDGLYYEVTHSGAKKETYVDLYQKIDNAVVPD